METKILTEDDIREYREIFPGWIAENLTRSTFTFLVATEENDTAGLVFVTGGTQEKNGEKTAQILWYAAKSGKTAKAVLSEYEAILKTKGIKKSIVCLPGKAELSETETDCLKKQGYDVATGEAGNLTVTTKEILSLDKLMNGAEPSKTVKPLKEFSGRAIRKGVKNCLLHDERMRFEDASELPLEWYDPEISCCIEAEGKPVGFLLIHKTPEGFFRPEVLTALKEVGKNGLFYMLRFSADALGRLDPDHSAQVLLPMQDEATRKLVSYFFPGKKQDAVLYAEKNL